MSLLDALKSIMNNYVRIKRVITRWCEVTTVIKSWYEVKWKIELMHNIDRDIEYEQDNAIKIVTQNQQDEAWILWSKERVFVQESAILARQGKFEKSGWQLYDV